MPPRTRSSDASASGQHRRPRAGGRPGSRRFALALAAGLATTLGTLGGAAPATAQTGSGGMQWTPVPEITRVACVRVCASKGRPRASGTVRVSGRNLEGVREVLFLGASGSSDDAEARPRRRGRRSLLVRVPMDAHTGPLSLVAGEVRSRPSRTVAVLPPPPPRSQAELTPAPGPRDPGAPTVETGTSQTRYFFGAERGVSFSFRIGGTEPQSVQVDLIRAGDGAVVRSWTPSVRPGEVATVVWDGLDAAGAPQAPGRYLFRLVAQTASGAVARSAQAQDVQRDAFDVYDHIFPVRGRHDYGGEGARFGAGRAGHSHQGQDVFARCGTRLVAARGGIVKFEQYHAAAGHYIVVDGEHTGIDYAYMHLQTASPFDPGDRVYTGQLIGRVGDTGNASGCHLHYEMWGPPGWYDGGAPFDPFDHLQAWDAYS